MKPCRLKGISFGSELNYISPIDKHKTPCLYIRDDNGKAVVFFKNAEWAARVQYSQLEWSGVYG